MDGEFESSFPVLTHNRIPMQSANLEPHITITVHHEQATAFLKEYATSKIEGLHLDYPKIIEAKAILNVQGKRHSAEILLYCANHIAIDASSETEDMYKSIDKTIDRIARRMRKYKTRLSKRHRPHAKDSIRFLDENIHASDVLATHVIEEEHDGPEPSKIHEEFFRLPTLCKEKAIMELEMSHRPFVLFRNVRRNVLQIVYQRREDSEYALLKLDTTA